MGREEAKGGGTETRRGPRSSGSSTVEHRRKSSRNGGESSSKSKTAGNNAPSSKEPPIHSPPSTSPRGSPQLAQPAAHRSRKEKLVVRSFSTEIEEGMEPRLVSYEEFFAPKTERKRGSRTRRTASAPVTTSAQNTPKGSDDEEKEAGVENDPSETPSEGGNGSSSRTTALKLKRKHEGAAKVRGKYKKRKVVQEPPAFQENGELLRLLIKSEDTNENENDAGLAEEAEEHVPNPSEKVYRRIGRPRKNNFKRKLQWPLHKSNSYSAVLKTSKKFVSHPPEPDEDYEVTGSPPKKSQYLNPLKVATKSPMKPLLLPTDSPKKSPLNKTTAPVLTQGLIQPQQHQTQPRQLVKYKVHEKFAKKLLQQQDECDATGIQSSQDGSSGFSYSDELLRKEQKTEDKEALLLPPPPLVQQRKPEFTPPPPPSDDLVASASDTTHQFSNNGLLEKSDNLYYYNKGLLEIMGLLDIHPFDDANAARVPELCRAQVAKLCNVFRKNIPIYKNSGELITREEREDSYLEHDVSSSSAISTINPLVCFAKKLLNKSKLLKELYSLNDSFEKDGQDLVAPPTKFSIGSFIKLSKDKTRMKHKLPIITEEELKVFKILLEPDESFECYEDEQELANLYCEMLRSEMVAADGDGKLCKGVNGSTPFIKTQAVENQKRVVQPLIVPARVPEGQHERIDADLLVTRSKLLNFLSATKRGQLKELNVRRLRNGKQVSMPKFLVRRKRKNGRRSRHAAVTIPPIVPGVNMRSDAPLRLRSGKIVLYSNYEGYELIDGELTNSNYVHVKVDIDPNKKILGAEDDTNSKASTSKNGTADSCSAWGFDSFCNTSSPKMDVVTQPIRFGGGPSYTTNLSDASFNSPSTSLTTLRGPPSTGMSSTLSSTPSLAGSEGFMAPPIRPQPFSYGSRPHFSCFSPYFFKPIHPYPLSNTGAFSAMQLFDSFPPPFSCLPFSERDRRNLSGNSIVSSRGSPTSLLKNRYTRRMHASICPPYDNNHCSYNSHHCNYPRAPNSRFCINHVDEGATVNFERCKYVKGTRECGLYIPKTSTQAVFCDIHALTIANARIRKSKHRKPLDKTEGLLKVLRCNLDRAEGKVMERNEFGSYSVRRDMLEDERETLADSSNTEESDEECNVIELYKAQKADDDSDVDDCDWGSAPDGNEPDYSCLKNAGYFTVDECVKMYRCSLLQMRDTLLQEMELLKRKYTMGWKNYQTRLRMLRSRCLNFSTDPKLLSTQHSDLTEAQLQKEIKVHNETLCLLNHRRNTGPRALCRHDVLKKRQEVFENVRAAAGLTTDIYSELPIHPNEGREEAKLRIRRCRKFRPSLCSFGVGTREKCMESCVVLTRFCRRHLAEDKNQRLYKPCNFRLGPDPEDLCHTPVLTELGKFGCSLHALPISVKDPPESHSKRPKVEDEIEKLIEEETMYPKEMEIDESEIPADEMIQEMEQLVGDELVDIEHFREVLTSMYRKGIYATDSEESEDTEEDEEEPQNEPAVNDSVVEGSFVQQDSETITTA